MNLYRYKVKIPSNVRYGHWEYKFTLLSILCVIFSLFEYFNGSYWFLFYAVFVQTILVGTFSEKISTRKGVLATLAIFAIFLFLNFMWVNYSLNIWFISIYCVVQLIVLIFSEQIDEYQKFLQG